MISFGRFCLVRLAFVVSLGFMLQLPTNALQELKVQNYSTNAICSQRNCLNPIFPGLQDLASLQTEPWHCSEADLVASHLRFCADVVNYDVALPANRSSDLASLVAEQEISAITAYRYHLAAMNKDAWEYVDPSKSVDPCVRSIWAMSCHTYLPKAQFGCQAGNRSEYLKPCRDVCESYVQACNVECCDESVKCVFELSEQQRSAASLLRDGEVVTSGYYDARGPSAECTGMGLLDVKSGARGRALPGLTLLLPIVLSSQSLVPRLSFGFERKRFAVFAVLALVATTLQGCDLFGGLTGGHATAAWQAAPSYLANFELARQADGWQLPVGQAVLNSCELVGLPKEQQCSGHGVCKAWNSTSAHPLVAPLSFCLCNRDWADPECRTRRKSQVVAYTLSLFGGPLGLDRFYLGQYYAGLVKLATLGGAGLWWISDAAYIGSAPVYANDYRLAADLPHWLFAITATMFFAGIGILVNNYWLGEVQKRRIKSKLQREAEAEYFAQHAAMVNLGAKDTYGTWGA